MAFRTAACFITLLLFYVAFDEIYKLNRARQQEILDLRSEVNYLRDEMKKSSSHVPDWIGKRVFP